MADNEPDKTRDGHVIVPGLIVWDHNMNQVRVVGPQSNRNPNEAQWYDMETLDGQRSAMMDGWRMSVRRPF